LRYYYTYNYCNYNYYTYDNFAAKVLLFFEICK